MTKVTLDSLMGNGMDEVQALNTMSRMRTVAIREGKRVTRIIREGKVVAQFIEWVGR